MRPWASVAIGALFLLVLASALTAVPRTASASYVSGISPVMGGNDVWVADVGLGQPGDIIKWNWTATMGDPIFGVVREPGGLLITNLTQHDGFMLEVWGEYFLRWFNDNPVLDQVSYTAALFTPSLSIDSPRNGTYDAKRNASLEGTFDGHADGVLSGLDAGHLTKVVTQGTNWSADNVALEEGTNTVLVRSYYRYGASGVENFTVDRTVLVIVDTSVPQAEIVAPADNESIRSSNVDVYWNCSDQGGLLRVDMKVDGSHWITVHWGGTMGQVRQPLHFSDGKHTVEIRAVDRAGNEAVAISTFSTNSDLLSSGGPYNGFFLYAVIASVLAIAGVFYLLLKIKEGPTTSPSPPPGNGSEKR